MILTASQIAAAAPLWNTGKDTFDIAARLGLHESFVHNSLPSIKEISIASRRPAFKVVR